MSDIRVLIADDQALVRGGFRVLVDAATDMTVVAEAANGAEAVSLSREHRPDVVLMDVRMPVLDGIEATHQIVAEESLRGTRILVLTTFDLDAYVFDALRAGASGFLLKDTPPENLLTAIRALAAGEMQMAPSVTRRLVQEFLDRPASAGLDHRPELETLTEREREVLLEVARGYSNGEIGEKLHMSPATAKTHVSRLLMKLGVHDRTQLAILAYETGMVTPFASE